MIDLISKNYTIKSEKQENGLWGIPISCMKFGSLSRQNSLKKSAILAAISELYPGQTFEVLYESEEKLLIKLSNGEWKSIKYNDYEVENNKILWIK